MRLEHRFVEDVPETLEQHVLYIALDCGTVVHLCACGCGGEAVTPLSRTDWSINYDGETVSLWPSVGNWSFPCQSHYFIKRGEVRWAEKWTASQIEEGRRTDRELKDGVSVMPKLEKVAGATDKPQGRGGWLSRAIEWIAG